jgi:hypothetical protein
VFSALHGELGGDLVVIDFLEVGANETNKKSSLTLAKFSFFLACALWEV